MNIWLFLKLKRTTFRKFHQLYQKKQAKTSMALTCSKRFDSDLIQSSPISSPTGDTTTESFKMVSDLDKSSDCLFVSPCVSPAEPTKKYAAHTNNFFR